MRPESHPPRQHGAGREPPVDEVKVAQRRRVGAQGEVEQQRVVRPGDPAPRRPQLRPGEADPRQVELQRVPDHPQPAGDVHQPQRRIAALDREPGDVDSDPPLRGRRHLQRRQPGVEVLEAPDPLPAVRAAPLDLQRRIARLGAGCLEPQRHRPVLDPYVSEQDQRRRPVGARPGVGAAQPEQLLDVEPPVAVLHDVDHGLPQGELEQHHAAGGEVEWVVCQVGPRQPRDEGRVGVEQADPGERHAGEERPAHVAHFDRPREHVRQGALGHARQQPPPGARADERRERAEEAGEQPDDHPQRDPERAADHQNACPTANCTITRRQNPGDSPGW